ncbi:MAG TPA: hypothetical protein VGI75_10800, partial [Pirellulales bacterium]
MPDILVAFDFLSRPQSPTIPPVCVLFGDEPLLVYESLNKLRSVILTGDDSELSSTTFDGHKLELRTVLDELATVSMFGSGRRLVIIEDADEFVSEHRGELESYCEKPRSSAVLLLIVQSWPGNTRLYKRVAEMGLA